MGRRAMIPASGSISGESRPARDQCAVCQAKTTHGSGFESYLSQTYEQRYANRNPRLCSHCGQRKTLTECCGLYCTQCTANSAQHVLNYQAQVRQGYSYGTVSTIAKSTTQATSLPAFQKTVKFLVTNSLEVFENSTIKAIEIMGKAKVEISDIETGSEVIDSEVFSSFLVGMLLNSKNILTHNLKRPKKL